MKKASGKSNLSIVRDYMDGNRPFIQVGYDPNLNNNKRKEGEIWEDSQGSKWIWKNGSKIKVPKIAKIIIEQRCNICNADTKWGNYLDQKVYPKTGRCYDCNIAFDSKLKILGVFEDYEKHKIYKSMFSEMNDFKQQMEESITYLESDNSIPKLQYFNEDGSQEFWTDDTDMKSKVLTDLKKDLINVVERIDELNTKISELKYDSSIEEKAKQMTLEKLNSQDQ
jgi:hypothetical protein